MSEDFATDDFRIHYILIAKNKILMLKPKIEDGHKYIRGPCQLSLQVHGRCVCLLLRAGYNE